MSEQKQEPFFAGCLTWAVTWGTLGLTLLAAGKRVYPGHSLTMAVLFNALIVGPLWAATVLLCGRAAGSRRARTYVLAGVLWVAAAALLSRCDTWKAADHHRIADLDRARQEEAWRKSQARLETERSNAATDTEAPAVSEQHLTPPIVSVSKIDVERFRLRFRGDGPPSGEWRERAAAHGFEFVNYEEKQAMRQRPGWPEPRQVDVSEVTLKNGDRTIVLVRDQETRVDEYTVHLVDRETGAEHRLKHGDTVTVGPREFRLIAVKYAEGSCVLEDTGSGEWFTLSKAPQAAVQE
jgi:hypothetical protein